MRNKRVSFFPFLLGGTDCLFPLSSSVALSYSPHGTFYLLLVIPADHFSGSSHLEFVVSHLPNRSSASVSRCDERRIPLVTLSRLLRGPSATRRARQARNQIPESRANLAIPPRSSALSNSSYVLGPVLHPGRSEWTDSLALPPRRPSTAPLMVPARPSPPQRVPGPPFEHREQINNVLSAERDRRTSNLGRSRLYVHPGRFRWVHEQQDRETGH